MIHRVAHTRIINLPHFFLPLFDKRKKMLEIKLIRIPVFRAQSAAVLSAAVTTTWKATILLPPDYQFKKGLIGCDGNVLNFLHVFPQKILL